MRAELADCSIPSILSASPTVFAPLAQPPTPREHATLPLNVPVEVGDMSIIGQCELFPPSMLQEAHHQEAVPVGSGHAAPFQLGAGTPSTPTIHTSQARGPPRPAL